MNFPKVSETSHTRTFLTLRQLSKNDTVMNNQKINRLLDVTRLEDSFLPEQQQSNSDKYWSVGRYMRDVEINLQGACMPDMCDYFRERDWGNYNWL